MGQVQSFFYLRYRDWGLQWFQSTSANDDKKELELFLRPLFSSFIAELGYHGPCNMRNEIYWKTLHQAAAETGIPHAKNTFSYKCLKAGGYYGVVSWTMGLCNM